jgi:hypothetical protein
MPEIVKCPECDKQLRIPDHLLGKAVSCPGCGKKFTARTAEEQGTDAVQDEPVSRGAAADRGDEDEERPARRQSRRQDEDEDEDDRPRRRRARDEDDDEDEDDRPRRRRRARDEDEDEDEDDRPRRRRPRDDDDDDEDDRPRRGRRSAGAISAAKGPGIALLVVGVLGLLMGLFYVVQAIHGRPMLGGPNQDVDNPAVLWVIAGVSLLWGAIVTLGGVKLMQLQSYGSVMVAVIFAMLPCNPCCLPGIPIAIWALVVMARPDVKRAFR